MRVLFADVHGGYTDSFLRGKHEYLFPPADSDGHGGLTRLDGAGPAGAREVDPQELRDDPPDVMVLQRLEDAQTFAALTGREPGRDVPAVFLEHNTPRTDVPGSRHPLADRPELSIVHVTHFNDLFWDCGSTSTTVVEHGVADPGPRYTGEIASCAFVVNEPVRRWRVTGTDLLSRFGELPVDAFGIDGQLLPERLGERCPRLHFAGNLGQDELYTALASRRLYLHLNRWTSLGLSLIQSMMLGLPVVVLDTTEASRAVPAEAGALSSDVRVLRRTAEQLLRDPQEAAERGRIARQAALSRYGIEPFLAEWDRALEDAVGRAGA